ncbi:hypothetical protein GCM10009733_042370 [Nonomuraea maheshkhaliensis]|uniref:Uncharacterized protein n=1 Tax=Nonomuraea maheshkhaliensis TaxID=419590 RepID=A0ABP4R8I7_9ACTN
MRPAQAGEDLGPDPGRVGAGEGAGGAVAGHDAVEDAIQRVEDVRDDRANPAGPAYLPAARPYDKGGAPSGDAIPQEVPR